MNHHVQDVENVIDNNLAISKVDKHKHEKKVNQNLAIDSTFATVDLGLSSDHSSNGNSPLPTDPPENLSKAAREDYERILPFDSKSISNLYDQGTLNVCEEVDDDRDSAIGNSESHSLMPGISATQKPELMGKFVPPSDLPIKTSKHQSIQNMHTPKVSLGEQIKLLHQVSQDEKVKQRTNLRQTNDDANQYHNFKPPLDLSETLDSERLEATTNIKERLNDVTSNDDKTLGEDKISRTSKLKEKTESNSKDKNENTLKDKISMPGDIGSGDKLMNPQISIEKNPISLDKPSTDNLKKQSIEKQGIDRR